MAASSYVPAFTDWGEDTGGDRSKFFLAVAGCCFLFLKS